MICTENIKTKNAANDIESEYIGTDKYNKDIENISCLTLEEEIMYGRMKNSADPEKAKKGFDALVEGNLRLVRYIAVKYKTAGIDLDDLIQEGNIGLMIAVNKYDPDSGVPFGCYAAHWIKMRIGRFLKANTSAVSTPEYIITRAGRYNRWANEFFSINGYEPDLEDIKNEFDCNTETAEMIKFGLHVTSLDNTSPSEDEKDDPIVFLKDDRSEREYENVEDSVYCEEAFETLAHAVGHIRAKVVWMKIYGTDENGKKMTFAAIGNELGCSRETARLWYNNVIERISRSPRLLEALAGEAAKNMLV